MKDDDFLADEASDEASDEEEEEEEQEQEGTEGDQSLLQEAKMLARSSSSRRAVRFAYDATAAAALLHCSCVPTALLIHCLLVLLYLLLLLQIRRGQLRSGSSLVLIASQVATYQCSAIISG